ncbi:MAG: DUF309 domain-containing protein [Byssovorax sp.]
MADEPAPPDPAFARYTQLAFPAYRYVPGRGPHPRRDPGGHSYRRPEPRSAPLDPAEWAQSSVYLYGVDLFNYAYWWEAHESFEAIWQVADKDGPLGQMLQGLIQIAAGNLKRFMEAESAAQKLGARGLARLGTVPSPFLGIDVRAFEAEARGYLAGEREKPALIRLVLPA